MSATGTEPLRASIRRAGRMGNEAVRDAGRTAAQRAVRRGGTGVARFDRYPSAHAAFVVAIYVLIPRLFDPAMAGDLDASFELRIRDPHGGDPDVSSVVVAQGKCRVVLGPTPPARVVVTTGADDIVRMASGEIGWPQLVSAGRLILWGDPYLALRFPLLFGLPAGPGKPTLLRLLTRRR
ncbi:MAG TPA: SCP2 sterol-binding domain-containing protein [Solirubrobacteraceae bacterium]